MFQNITFSYISDTLEQVVGIQNVVQCHGSFATATCMKCKNKVDAEVIREDIFAQKIPNCPKCRNNSENQQEIADPQALPGMPIFAHDLGKLLISIKS